MFIRSQNVLNSGLSLEDVAFIDEATHHRMAASEVYPFDVLLNITGASIGRCCVVPMNFGPANANQHVCSIRLAKPNQRDAQFLAAVLASHIGQKQVWKLNAGGNREGLNYQQIRSFVVPWPAQAQRWKVADILAVLDETIAQTEALIAKYEQIRLGLMHDLFTRGLTSDGRLRLTASQAPHLYKKSPVGWLPNEWDISTLGQCCEWTSGGTPSRNRPEWWDGDFPWLTPKDMKAFELFDTSEHISPLAARIVSRLAKAGTVFIVVRGMILAHSFPVVIGLREFAFNQDIKAVCARGDLSNRFLAYWFRAHRDTFLKRTSESTHGTKRFDLRELLGMVLAVPSIEEQIAVVDRLDTIGAAIDEEGRSLAKLYQQKQGLVQDLLGGRLRVEVS
ncbi:MAG: restriction endonuclease subunit S [Bryobacteraceae bacterium]|nr:restriction endonuclease subunit S [Bryobacteraceae bacterium]